MGLHAAPSTEIARCIPWTTGAGRDLLHALSLAALGLVPAQGTVARTSPGSAGAGGVGSSLRAEVGFTVRFAQLHLRITPLLKFLALLAGATDVQSNTYFHAEAYQHSL